MHRSLVDQLPQRIFIKDRDLRYIDCNKGFAADLGTTPEQVIGKNDFDFFPTKMAQAYREDDLDVLTSGNVKEVEEPFISAGGQRWVKILKTPYRDEAENIRGVIGIFTDITEQKQREAAYNDREKINLEILQASADRQRAILDGLDALVYVTDMETYELLFVNEYGKKIWGDITGKTCWQALQVGLDAPCPFCTNAKLVTSEGNSAGVYTWEFQNTVNGRWYDCRDQAIPWDDGRLVRMEIATDITERKNAEEDLARAIEEVRRSNRELEQFAYVASHDLQEPLRMVSSYTQLLERRYRDKLDDKAGKFIDYAVDGAVRMQQLINDLLLYSRVNTQGKTPEETDSGEIFELAKTNLTGIIRETGAKVTCDALPRVKADPLQLLQLFQNLISNGIKFRRSEPPEVHVSAQDDGTWLHFQVRDNGVGIDSAYKDKIFIIFQRLHTREEYPGTGIGLAVCKRIVERHGGTIDFTSEPGRGTIFHFTLPG